MSAAYKNSTLAEIADRVISGIRVVNSFRQFHLQKVDELNFEEYKWEFKNQRKQNMKMDDDLEKLTYDEGFDFTFIADRKREEINRDVIPSKVLNQGTYNCFCLLEEIGITQQWVPCKVVKRKKDMYTVELKSKPGFELKFPREKMLLNSKLTLEAFDNNY
jgi:hypothetical protein